MISSTAGRRGCVYVIAAASLLVLAGCSGGELNNSAQPVAAAAALTQAPPTTPGTAAAKVEPDVLPRAKPTAVQIPSIGAQSKLLDLGLEADGSLQVPPDGPGAPAGWYNGSPTPGERGPAVLLGHVNSTGGGPGVFAHLRKLKVGDTIEVKREDGTTAVFAFDRGEQYSKNAFPSQKVYGNTVGAELRLITCDGFNPLTGEFDDNYVVYAKLAR